jgi:hypothetical protein
MGENTGKGHREGAVKKRTEFQNPRTGQYVKRNRDPDSEHNGEFMNVKEDGTQHKGVANEPDKRRKGAS